MNRFPKMMILWYEVLSLEYPTVSNSIKLATAYAIALGYAILKNAKFHINEKEKKDKMQFNAASPKDSWNVIEIPGKHPPFLKKIKYRVSREGVIVAFNGESKDFYLKALQQLRKFDHAELERYREYAREIAKMLKKNCYVDWFETWKKIRDLDWDTVSMQKTVC